jgi:hypothetical protein
MSSSDGRGGTGKSPSAEELDPWFGVTERPAAEGTGNGGEPASGWPEPGPASGAAGQDAGFDPAATLTDWFLPGGRAALLPDSMTVAVDAAEPAAPDNRQLPQAEAPGMPPWASERTQSSAGTPPPWENGPWPGPGMPRPSAGAEVPDLRPEPAARRDDPAGLWTPRAILITGLLPLVLPGLVVGVLGLRRSRSGKPGRAASVLALIASLAWAAVIVVVLAATSGGSAGGCTYPAAVHQAYAQAMTDISGNVPAAQLAADLGTAASRANSAAAAATDIQGRNELFAMAADLQQARADVITQKAVPGSLRAHLSADGAALAASCRA